ncbi:EAL domain-containing protein [Aquipuribacter sp. MA13-6]|uniref:EAL domain-containing protein n=1 Tax=unclassified Aquipuribacter TaxID=2635084 RepID=UPI003EEB31E6
MRSSTRQRERHQLAVAHGPTSSELRSALRHDGLEVAQQPVVRLADGVLVGTESLVRWTHPRLGLLLPGSFLHLAQTLDEMPALDLLVMRAACRRLAASPFVTPTSVNVSRATLLQRGFVATVLRTLREYGVDGARLLLELSEELTLDDLELVRDELLALRRAGVQLALDDLGAGVTTLQHVRMLEPAFVKVDRSLVTGVHTSPHRLAAVARVVDLARATGAAVTAEGVEEQAEADALLGLGCERGQGWLFGRPVLQPATDRINHHGDDQRPQERPGAQHRRKPLVGGGVPAREAG